MRDYDGNCYDREPNIRVYEVHLDEGKVERAGYMEVEDIVRDLIESGERLEMYREAMYPNEESVRDDDNGDIVLNKIDSLQRVLSVKKVLKKEKEERERLMFESKMSEEKEKDKVEEVEGVKKEEDMKK